MASKGQSQQNSQRGAACNKVWGPKIGVPSIRRIKEKKDLDLSPDKNLLQQRSGIGKSLVGSRKVEGSSRRL